MGRRILLVGVALMVLALAGLGAVLGQAHLAIRRERSPLPLAGDVSATLAGEAGGPAALRWIDTASQEMPRPAVLDPDLDPTPDAPYRMSHPSFVLEWPDGRLLLVDLGMTEAAARDFGEPLETFVGAAPMQPHRSTAEALGARGDDVAGVVLSHLHRDHVEGITALCAKRKKRLPVYATEAQLERPNYLTRPGLELLRESDCVDLVELEGGPMFALPGFPGVRVIAAGGHTPGSQIVVAQVGEKLYGFAGDIVNAHDGIVHDVPKPWLYRTFLVPEDEARQGELRRWLREVEQDHGGTVLVAHDELFTESAGVAAWGEASQ